MEKSTTQAVPIFFFHRSQDQALKTDYRYVFEPDGRMPSRVASALTDLHSKLAGRLRDIPDVLWVTLPVEAEIAYTIAACFSKLLGNERRPFLRMLAVAVASEDLRDYEIDPIEFLRTVEWDYPDRWKAFDRIELAEWIGRPAMPEAFVDELVRSRDGHFTYDDHLDHNQVSALLSKAIRRMNAEDRYRHAYVFNATEKLKLPFNPKYIVYQKTKSKTPPPIEEANPFDTIIANLHANNQGNALLFCQVEAYRVFWLHMSCSRRTSYRSFSKSLRDFESKAKEAIDIWRACRVREESVAELKHWCNSRSAEFYYRLKQLRTEQVRNYCRRLILGIIVIAVVMVAVRLLFWRHYRSQGRSYGYYTASYRHSSVLSDDSEGSGSTSAVQTSGPTAWTLRGGDVAPAVTFTPLGAKQAIHLAQNGDEHGKVLILEFTDKVSTDDAASDNIDDLAYLADTNKPDVYLAIFSKNTTNADGQTFVKAEDIPGHVDVVVGSSAAKVFKKYRIHGYLPQVFIIGQDDRIAYQVGGTDVLDSATLDNDVSDAMSRR